MKALWTAALFLAVAVVLWAAVGETAAAQSTTKVSTWSDHPQRIVVYWGDPDSGVKSPLARKSRSLAGR